MPIRGGNWNQGAISGVFNLNLNNSRANAGTNIGFRSALPSRQMAATQGLQSSTVGR